MHLVGWSSSSAADPHEILFDHTSRHAPAYAKTPGDEPVQTLTGLFGCNLEVVAVSSQPQPSTSLWYGRDLAWSSSKKGIQANPDLVWLYPTYEDELVPA